MSWWRLRWQSPYLAEPIYAGELSAWSRAEARCLLLARWIDQHGPLDAEGVPRPALAALTQQERLAGELRHRLELTPLVRAKLGRDVAGAQVDLADLMARLDQGSARDPHPYVRLDIPWP